MNALWQWRSGAYAESIGADIPPVRLRQFFYRPLGQYVVSRTLRESVTFSIRNLLRDPPFSKLAPAETHSTRHVPGS
jgi:two-component system CheB/CheR fusion protein